MMKAWRMWDLSSETMGPVWPCRTRAVLLGLLEGAVGRPGSEHLIVLRRGLSAEERARRDRKAVKEDIQMVEHMMNGEGLAHMATYEYIAAPLFKADDGYIVRHVPSFPVNDENWTRNTVKACADMVLTYVGEVEP